MIGLAIITGLLVAVLAALRIGVAVERRRMRHARLSWQAATDQAVQLTQIIRDADQQQWAEVARALAPEQEYRGYNR